ncbi:MAG: 23S rRNA (adenine(2503)-C(2))-methyltransferase RlmN [Desulfobulbaceae bacterium]|jgi:23S rRNA (adenine2503-C2)-methyltransferase|nr:23S rRNA (adenine(2503)-C(2))-methyltransferase RlmN [Desulfobulbaceae bacterium]MDY0350483.1 23S rRNA (adenine(2503)-C(2))-methyltransferase RlmN [Desulfobulbaceae bacterium]
MRTPDNKTDLKNLSRPQLVRYVEELGQPSFRGEQILAWLYRPGITDFSQMTDLAKEFRSILSRQARISRFENPVVEESRDGSVKFCFSLEDGHTIESVLIPEEERNTLCVSSQAGCAMGCHFCVTGKMGLKRNLKPAEIVNQVCGARDWMLSRGRGRLTNLVFMGMGEPLANLDNLLTALSILNEQRGLDFSNRRMTVSTCGLVPQMIEFGRKTEVNLAVSLHAVDNATRTMLMPVNRTYPLEDLLEACRHYQMKKRQRIMFEYTLLEGINDADDSAVRLAEMLRGIPCKINLLAMNSTGDDRFRSPAMERILKFQDILRRRGYTVFIRQSRGEDISAACGQLAGRVEQALPG